MEPLISEKENKKNKVFSNFELLSIAEDLKNEKNTKMSSKGGVQSQDIYYDTDGQSAISSSWNTPEIGSDYDDVGDFKDIASEGKIVGKIAAMKKIDNGFKGSLSWQSLKSLRKRIKVKSKKSQMKFKSSNALVGKRAEAVGKQSDNKFFISNCMQTLSKINLSVPDKGIEESEFGIIPILGSEDVSFSTSCKSLFDTKNKIWSENENTITEVIANKSPFYYSLIYHLKAEDKLNERWKSLNKGTTNKWANKNLEVAALSNYFKSQNTRSNVGIDFCDQIQKEKEINDDDDDDDNEEEEEDDENEKICDISGEIKKMNQNIKTHLKNVECSDYKIIAGGMTFLVNKSVISTETNIYSRLESYTKEQIEEGIMKIDNVPAEAMKKLLFFIYTGKVHITNDITVYHILKLANLFQVKSLVMICERYIIENLNFDNVKPCLKYLSKFHNRNIQHAVTNFLEKYFSERRAQQASSEHSYLY